MIRDPAMHRQVLAEVLRAAKSDGFGIEGLIRLPLLGPKGNAEFLVEVKLPAGEMKGMERLIETALTF